MHKLATQGLGSDNTTKLREIVERQNKDLRARAAAMKKSDKGVKLLGQELNSALDQVTFYKTAHRDLEIALQEVRAENVQLFHKCKKAVDDAARAQGELEHLKREIHRLNEELVRLRDEVILDVQGMILALPPNCPEFKGDPNELATARWWSGLYQEAAMGCQLTATPAIMPDSAVPSEVCVEDVASTSRTADRED